MGISCIKFCSNGSWHNTVVKLVEENGAHEVGSEESERVVDQMESKEEHVPWNYGFVTAAGSEQRRGRRL